MPGLLTHSSDLLKYMGLPQGCRAPVAIILTHSQRRSNCFVPDSIDRASLPIIHCGIQMGAALNRWSTIPIWYARNRPKPKLRSPEPVTRL
jgi:hypothetical protein